MKGYSPPSRHGVMNEGADDRSQSSLRLPNSGVRRLLPSVSINYPQAIQTSYCRQAARHPRVRLPKRAVHP
jgi:hypothetical protein